MVIDGLASYLIIHGREGKGIDLLHDGVGLLFVVPATSLIVVVVVELVLSVLRLSVIIIGVVKAERFLHFFCL